MTEKRLFLLDAYALIFRAYYALIRMPRITQSGFNTSAIFGFVNTLEELLNKEKPTHIAVCFDPSGPTFRHEAYDAYKGEREATPEDIKLSVPIIKDIIRAYRIPILEVPGFEADDVIGTMAKMAESEGFTTYMMTPDKDFGQLVSPGIFQYKPSYKGQDIEVRGEKEVCERYGIKETKQVIDLLALMGDKIDNIPGCPGVGEKTAVKLIEQFGNIDSLITHADELKGALRKKVEENAEQIRFSYFLATIRTDVPIETSPEELVCKQADREKLFSIFKELEFRTLISRVEKRIGAEAKTEAPQEGKKPTVVQQPSLFDGLFDEPAAAPTPEIPIVTDISYSIAETADDLSKLKSKLSAIDKCAIFVAAEGEADMTSSPIGAAIAYEPGKAVFIPFSFEDGKQFMLSTLADSNKLKVTRQAKRDYEIATKLSAGSNKDVLTAYYDLSIAHYLLQPEMRHTPESLAESYLHQSITDLETIIGKKGAKEWDLRKLSKESLIHYCCEQADIVMRLYPIIDAEVQAQGLNTLLQDIELPLVKVLADMEMTGVRIDVATLNKATVTLSAKMGELEKEIYTLAGEEFNVSSPSKVGEILFDKLQLDPKAKKTKTGQYSTSEDVLEKLAYKNPIIGKILEYRQLKKLISTYLIALPASINPATGKVHTTYNQTVTATGRISSSNPNLQNIPVRDELGRDIRKAFIADNGHLFLSADYSQIELRLVADFADDNTMLNAFKHGDDIHAITAAKIYHVPVESVTKNQRRNAKTANFGIIYGISAFGLSSRLGIPRSEAKELIDNYFATFPGIRQYMSDSIECAKTNGYVETRMGRKRMLPDINSRNPVVRGYAERNAVNAPIQGSAADIIKRAMVDIAREMKKTGVKSKMIMQVHDELNFDVVPEELEYMQKLVAEKMEAAYRGKVVLSASCGVADNWLDAH
jgi:DNA polymerase-1